LLQKTTQKLLTNYIIFFTLSFLNLQPHVKSVTCCSHLVTYFVELLLGHERTRSFLTNDSFSFFIFSAFLIAPPFSLDNFVYTNSFRYGLNTLVQVSVNGPTPI